MSKNTATARKPAQAAVQSDKNQAAERGKPERLQALGRIATGEDLYGTALVDMLRTVLAHGPTSTAEIAEGWPSCNNPKVYASYFNSADAAQKIVGLKAAEDIIATAEKAKGSTFANACKGFAYVRQAARDAGEKTLKPAAAKLAVKGATAAITAPKDKAPAPAAKKGAQGQKTATIAAAAIEAGQGPKAMANFLTLASQNAHRLPTTAGREQLHREACKALADAAEKWNLLAKG